MTPLLPPFNEHGLLPVGIYPLSPRQLLASHLVTGAYSQQGEAWDAEHRARLVHNVVYLARQLWQVGVTEVFVFGSFVDDKACPNDIDSYFVYPSAKPIRNGRLRRALNEINAEKAWDWLNRLPDETTGKNEMILWHVYRVEVVPTAPDLKNAMPVEGTKLPIPTGVHIASGSCRIKGVVQLVPDTDDPDAVVVTPTVFSPLSQLILP